MPHTCDIMSSPAPPSADGGPYRVEQTPGPDGNPRWRLTGPGLGPTKAYPWAEVRDKLDELAALMNFAWRQGQQGKP